MIKKWAIYRMKAFRVGINDFKVDRILVSNGFDSKELAESYLVKNRNTTKYYEISEYYQGEKGGKKV